MIFSLTGLQKSTVKTPEPKSDWDRIKSLYTIVLRTGSSNSSVANEQNDEMFKFFDDEKKLEAQMKQRHEELKREQKARELREQSEGLNQNNEIRNHPYSNDDPFALFMFIIICFVFVTVFIVSCIRSPSCTAYWCLRIVLNDGRNRDSCCYP